MGWRQGGRERRLAAGSADRSSPRRCTLQRCCGLMAPCRQTCMQAWEQLAAGSSSSSARAALTWRLSLSLPTWCPGRAAARACFVCSSGGLCVSSVLTRQIVRGAAVRRSCGNFVYICIGGGGRGRGSEKGFRDSRREKGGGEGGRGGKDRCDRGRACGGRGWWTGSHPYLLYYFGSFLEEGKTIFLTPCDPLWASLVECLGIYREGVRGAGG